jgi:cGMP-dependent protein kinase
VNKLIDSVDERNEEIESPREMKNINLNQNFAETISENVRIINKIKQPHDQNLILQQLKNHFVFYNLSEAELENIVNKMFYCEV